jgi:hypothetical protein
MTMIVTVTVLNALRVTAQIAVTLTALIQIACMAMSLRGL